MPDNVIELAISKDCEHKASPPELSPIERAERNAHLARAFRRLEGEIRDVERMARIAMVRIQDSLGAPPSLNGCEAGNYYIPEEEAEVDLFAVCHVFDMCVDLRQKYDAAFHQAKA